MTTTATPQARLFEKLDRDEFDSDGLGRGLLGPFSVVAAILRAPGALIRDLRGERNLSRYMASLMLTTLLFSAAYGAILGSKFTFRQTLSTVLFLSASVALVLGAFAPISWFFTVSTRGPGFLVFLHLFVFFIGAMYGIHSLNTARKYLDRLETAHTPIHGAFLFLWFMIVLFVALQMAYYLRPFFDPLPGHGFWLGERGLFFEALGAPYRKP